MKIISIFLLPLLSKVLCQDPNADSTFVGLPRERLIANALAAEKYHNLKLNGRKRLGGLHDYVTRLSDSEIAQYISKEEKEHPELNVAEKVQEWGLSLEFELEDLEHMLYRVDRSQLINFALASEQQHRVETNTTDLIGGLHDYVSALSDDELRAIIIKEAKEHKALNSFNKYSKVTKEFGFLEDFEKVNLEGELWRKSQGDLINLAFTAETVERSHMEPGLLGGLHDYVEQLSKEQLITYINERAQKYEEIKSFNLLEKQRLSFNFTGDFLLENLKHMLARENRNTLINLALTAEAEERQTLEPGIVGGLRDTIAARSDEYLMTYILERAGKFEQLKSINKIKELSQKYGFTSNSFELEFLNNMLWRTDVESLKKMALATEKLHRDVNKINIDGGLHDYVRTLTKDQLIEYIMKECKEHPEIQSIQALEQYTNYSK